jgi:hypothetical protein
MWGWLILALVMLLGVLYARQLWRTIAGLATYVVFLLLSDEFRDQERARLEDWVEGVDCSNDAAVMVSASAFVLDAAQELAKKGPRALARPAASGARKAA